MKPNYNCNICSKSIEITTRSYKRNINKNNGKFICQSCKIKSYIGPVLEQRNKNPEFQKKNSDKLKDYWASDEGLARKESMRTNEYVDRLRNQAKKAWENEEYREIKSEQSKQLILDPEFVQILVDRSTELWNNDKYRNKVIDNMDFEAIGLNSKKMWENEVFRNKMITVIRERWRDQEWKDKWYKRIMSDEIKEKRVLARANSAVTLGLEQSIPHKIVVGILNDLNIEYQEEYPIGFYNFDFFLPEHNLIIEVQGDYWHNLPKAIRRDKAKATYIAEYFPDHKLRYIWEHETKCPGLVENSIKYWSESKIDTIDFDFGGIVFRRIDNIAADMFLAKYHYLRKLGRNAYVVGAYLNNKLVAVCCFASVTRKQTADSLSVNPKDIRELTRFCIHPSYHKKNFASWFLSRAVKLIKQQSSNLLKLVAFSDLTFNHDGGIYKASNWELDRIVKPSYWYVNEDGFVMHKKTLWDHAQSLKMGEKEFANKYGYKKINGKEKYRYVFQYL